MQSMQHQLNERDSKIALLESDLERKRIENPDMSGVLAEIESGKVAASRALIQNQELKEQLEEIQKAYIQVVSCDYRSFVEFISMSDNIFTLFFCMCIGRISFLEQR